MKIGIDIRAIGRQRTGDEVYTLNLVKNLLKVDRKNQYFFYTNTRNKSDIEAIRNKIDPENIFSNFSIAFVLPKSKAFWTFFSLPWHLVKNPVDVLHVQYITPFWLPKKTKLITTIHDVSFRAFSEHIDKKDLLFLKSLLPISLARADEIIAVSHFTKNEIAKYYKTKKEKISVVWNGGASGEFFEEISGEKIDFARRKYEIEKPFVLYVGTHQPRKKIPLMLRAFERLKNENENNEKIKEIQLVITGKRNGHNSDKEIDKTLDKIEKRNPEIFKDIRFIGFVDDKDLPAVYQEAKVFCFPSLYEGFGLPSIEAMASGVPVLCSDSSCFREINEENVLYFKENDLSDFTKKLFDIIMEKNLREELQEKGKKRAIFFDWEKCAGETIAVYEKIAGKL